jgi:DNA-binding beta-propeller fold protein YncE
MMHANTGRLRRRCLVAVFWAFAAGAVWGSPGCAGRSLQPGFWEGSELDRVWPAPPERARIGYLGAIHSAEDLGRTRNWLQKLGDRVLGSSPVVLVKPMGVARNGNGLLAVTDPSFPTVHFFDLERREHRWLEEDVSSRLSVPVGVALDDRGGAYVSDSARRKIFVTDAEGQLIGTIGEGVLERPTGIALDPSQQRLYVVDTLACQVLTFALNGRLLGRFGSRGAGPGQLNGPTYIAVAPDGNLAVSDTLNFRIQIFAPDGTPLHAFGRAGDSAGAFARPKGIAYDRYGRLYVADGGFDNVQIFDPRGRLLLTFGAAGREAGELNLPVGLILDSTQTVWVADSYNRRVQAFRLLED